MRVNAVTKMPDRIPIGILRSINDLEGWGRLLLSNNSLKLTLGKIDFSSLVFVVVVG